MIKEIDQENNAELAAALNVSEEAIDIVDMIDDDLPDGAYYAMIQDIDNEINFDDEDIDE